MAKAKKISSKFMIVDAGENVVGFENTLSLAEIYASSNELQDCKIYEVVKAYNGWYPEDPDLEFSEVGLEDIV